MGDETAAVVGERALEKAELMELLYLRERVSRVDAELRAMRATIERRRLELDSAVRDSHVFEMRLRAKYELDELDSINTSTGAVTRRTGKDG